MENKIEYDWNGNENEQLKEICDKIWFTTGKKDNWTMRYITFSLGGKNTYYFDLIEENEDIRVLNVREIIFTKEFMDKYIDYCLEHWLEDISFSDNLLSHLDNPVGYLYNLIIKIWIIQK